MCNEGSRWPLGSTWLQKRIRSSLSYDLTCRPHSTRVDHAIPVRTIEICLWILRDGSFLGVLVLDRQRTACRLQRTVFVNVDRELRCPSGKRSWTAVLPTVYSGYTIYNISRRNSAWGSTVMRMMDSTVVLLRKGQCTAVRLVKGRDLHHRDR